MANRNIAAIGRVGHTSAIRRIGLGQRLRDRASPIAPHRQPLAITPHVQFAPTSGITDAYRESVDCQGSSAYFFTFYDASYDASQQPQKPAEAGAGDDMAIAVGVGRDRSLRLLGDFGGESRVKYF